MWPLRRFVSSRGGWMLSGLRMLSSEQARRLGNGDGDYFGNSNNCLHGSGLRFIHSLRCESLRRPVLLIARQGAAMTSSGRVRIALVGAGLFARDCYLPTLKSLSEIVEVVGVWSRGEASAAECLPTLQSWSPAAVAYHGEDGLDDLLARQDLHAVAVVLPCHVQLGVVKRALQAGKSVLQEKPIAGTAAEAKEALEWYETLQAETRPLWSIAENYRFEGSFLKARELLPSLGQLIKADLVVDAPMDKGNKYFGSAWRRDPASCPGGFLMEGPVHFLAALRLVTGQEATEAQGRVFSHPESGLPAPDTVVGSLQLSNGRAASVSISFAAGARRFSLSAVGLEGTVEVQRDGPGYSVRCSRRGQKEPYQEFFPFQGVEEEIRNFASCVGRWRDGEAAVDLGPGAAAEGFRDLAAIEALIASGLNDGLPQAVLALP